MGTGCHRVEGFGVDLAWFQECECLGVDFFLGNAVIRSPEKGVWLVSFLSWSKDDDEVETRELFCPSSLATIVDLGFRESKEILVIRVDGGLVSEILKVVSPLLHALDYDQHFSIINFIID